MYEVFLPSNFLLGVKLNDELFNLDIEKKLGTLQFSFDIEKKQSQINLLTKDQELKQQEIKRQPLEAARATKSAPTWTAAPTPEVQGLHTVDDRELPLGELVPRIDWTPFFQAWELSGPYPKILQDPVVGEAARKLHSEALAHSPSRISSSTPWSSPSLPCRSRRRA